MVMIFEDEYYKVDFKSNSTSIKSVHRIEVCIHLYTMKDSNLLSIWDLQQ